MTQDGAPAPPLNELRYQRRRGHLAKAIRHLDRPSREVQSKQDRMTGLF